MDWNKIAKALQSAASETGLNAFDYVPDSLPNFGFYVGEIDIDFDLTMRRMAADGTRRGTDTAMITCRVLVARYDDKQALIKLREYMGGSGVKSLVQHMSNNRRLTYEGVDQVHDSQVKQMRGNRLFQVGQDRYYGVELDIFVIGDA